MNIEARQQLDDLLNTEPNSLTPSDIEFLRARSSYLSDAQKEMLKQFEVAKKDEAKAEADEADKKAKADAKELKK